MTAQWGWLGNTGNACEPNICYETQHVLHTVFIKACEIGPQRSFKGGHKENKYNLLIYWINVHVDPTRPAFSMPNKPLKSGIFLRIAATCIKNTLHSGGFFNSP